MTLPVSGGVPEPAECELEAIAALFTSALSQVGNWQDRARYLFDRGVRIQDGAALERPRPALPPLESWHKHECRGSSTDSNAHDPCFCVCGATSTDRGKSWTYVIGAALPAEPEGKP